LVEGTLIDAGSQDPYELFSTISSKERFLISPQMNEKTSAVDHAIFAGSALFLQVLEGNSRNTVQVIRAYYAQGSFAYCLTNYGDVNRSERLEKEECEAFLGQENAVLVMIEFPDDSLQRPVIELGQDKIVVKSNSQESIDETCFLALRIMFENAREVIERSNVIFGRITG